MDNGKAAAADAPPRARRLDARRNRDRVIEAALVVFAETGVDAQMADIAEAANVGVATLYRNFPTKEDLTNALLEEFLDRVVAIVEQAAEVPDPWEGLVRFFEWMTTIQLENRALPQFFAGRIPGTPELDERRHTIHRILKDLTDRAKAEGHLRVDVNNSDLRFVLFAISRLASSEPLSGDPAKVFQRLTRRFLAVILDGLRPNEHAMSDPPVTSRAFDAATLTSAGRNGDGSVAFRRGRRAWPTSL